MRKDKVECLPGLDVPSADARGIFIAAQQKLIDFFLIGGYSLRYRQRKQ